MAGDWIKMRVDLRADPAVISIANSLKLDEDTVVGKLHLFWSWLDQQTVDGNALGVTAAWLDRYVQRTGFAKALASAGWLTITKAGISAPDFEKHNGETAKQRALTAIRAANFRQNHKGKRNGAGVTNVTEGLKREEKRKEEPRKEKRRELLEKRKRREEFPPLPPQLDTDEFRATWAAWEQYRKEIRKTLTPSTRVKQLKLLEPLGATVAIETINRTIQNGWIGLFPEEKKRGTTGSQGTSVSRGQRHPDDRRR